MTSLEQHLRVVLDLKPQPALVGTVSRQRISELTAQLPAGLTEFFGLECRLGDEQPYADFLLCIKPDHGAAILAGATEPGAIQPGPIKSGSLPNAWFEEPVWKRLAHFARWWCDGAFGQRIDNIWLEFDLDETLPTIPVPSIFIGTELRGPDVSWLTDAVMPALTGHHTPAGLRHAMESVLTALPDHAWVFQVGLMLARPSAADGVRLCVRGLGRDHVDFLQRLDWAKDDAALAAATRDALECADTVDLDIDLLRVESEEADPVYSLGSKIGFECAFAAAMAPAYRLPQALSELVDKGLCLTVKQRAVEGWSAGFNERKNSSQWPADLLSRSAALGPGTASVYLRWPYHIKLVYERGKGLSEAKAYLAMRQFWPTKDDVNRITGTLENTHQGAASTNSE